MTAGDQNREGSAVPGQLLGGAGRGVGQAAGRPALVVQPVVDLLGGEPGEQDVGP
jgi:hypothetical protein